MKSKWINNTLLASIFLAIGLGLGWLLFGNNSQQATTNTALGTEPAAATTWTCSMHPQIRQPDEGDCPICGMDLIPLEASGSAVDDSPIRLVMTKEAVKLAQIQTMQVGAGEKTTPALEKEILLTGKVKMDERKSTSQNAHLSGRIEKLYVDYIGEEVRKGQKIAEVYAPELVLAQKELLEAQKVKTELPALYKAAQEKIRQWKLPESVLENLEKTGEVQQTLSIYADHAGVVMKKYVEEGDYMKAGKPMFELMDLTKLWVLFDVYEKDLAWIKKGQVIEFNLAAMPEKTFKSAITFIDPIINPITRVASARVEIYNSKGQIKPDMFAKGILRASPQTQRKKGKSIDLVVPKTAVMWTGKRSVVYIKVPDVEVPSFEFREVELGADLGDSYIVQDGINSGEEVVVHGTFKIDAAAQLNNKASMMNRMVDIKKEPQLPPDFRASTPQKFKQQLQTLTEAYLKLKDDLVNSDETQAKNKISELEQALQQVDMKLLEGDAHLYWMEVVGKLEQELATFDAANSLDNQRLKFSTITTLLLKAIEAFGNAEGRYFVQYCPMAFDDEGASWLSKEEKIRNPYFGDAMLSCGIIKKEIQN